ncbi:carbohydrate ABC transporter permease [Bacillus sp. FJAT-47783]|uniref:carbohydrate ABC transporter permease n=1 Tax=Bacillus sp. FJAT-47783 TaxID=2922712 RepID=UPI001FAE37E0|nr:carbohydrate ABC transporter permease [Bacillus sp. FJAT-47783]
MRKLVYFSTISIRHAVLLVASFVMFFPFLWMVTNSIKTNEEIWSFPPIWWPKSPEWHNFIDAWTMAPFSQYIWNSVFTATCIVGIQLINSAMMAYALTQFRFPGKNILFAIILSSYMLPVAATYVPSYVTLANLNLLDTYTGIIISNSASVFGIFLLRQAFLQVPKEMVESARMDGASHWQILWKIYFPLTKPSFITLGLISFIQMYNNYLWPSLIVKSEEKMLITQGLRQFFIQEGAYGINWPLIMAASTFTIVPLLLLFAFMQKWFVSAISSDQGVKG